jgi:hypothetical protein
MLSSYVKLKIYYTLPAAHLQVHDAIEQGLEQSFFADSFALGGAYFALGGICFLQLHRL